jgi:glycosyltransferase involved in cell wall biosynthesis
MRIALIASSVVTVPPKAFGSVEVFTAELGKMLTRLGHHVVVYASGDSRPGCDLRFRFSSANAPAEPRRELMHAAYAWRDIGSREIPFDVVHASHAPALAVGGTTDAVTVFTLHHDRDESLLHYYGDFPDVCYVAMSDSQVRQMPELDFSAVIHGGLDPDAHPAGAGEGGYCAFLGKLVPEKAPHHALDASRLAGIPLHLGAPEHAASADYFAQEIVPRLDAAGSAVQWLGNLSGDRKLRLLQNAQALLVPLAFEEPCGLAMIESMLVGTPVVAFARGSARELIEDGVTGFLVRDAKEMAARLKQIGSLSRASCRARAVERWSSMRMATAYEGIYEERIRARRQRGTRERTTMPMPMRRSRPAELSGTGPRWSGLFSPFWEA